MINNLLTLKDPLIELSYISKNYNIPFKIIESLAFFIPYYSKYVEKDFEVYTNKLIIY